MPKQYKELLDEQNQLFFSDGTKTTLIQDLIEDCDANMVSDNQELVNISKLVKLFADECNSLDNSISVATNNQATAALEACSQLLKDTTDTTSQQTIKDAYEDIKGNKELGAHSNAKLILGAIVGTIALVAAAALTVLTLASAGVFSPASVPVIGGCIAAGTKLLSALAGSALIAKLGMSATCLGGTAAVANGLFSAGGLAMAVNGREKGPMESMHRLFDHINKPSITDNTPNAIIDEDSEQESRFAPTAM